MRTNKTTQAINRAINTLSNPMHIPRTLSTTFGYELTFMPQLNDRMWHKSKGTIKAWMRYDELVSAYASIMHQVAQMHNNKRTLRSRYIDFKTDPHVVEVTTKPTNSGPRLRNIVRDAFKYADVAELQPRCMYSRGGGAHLHVGLLGESRTDKHSFAVAMQHEVMLNPWISWAFANPLDDDNAPQIPHLRIARNTDREVQTSAQRAQREVLTLEYNIRDSEGDARYYDGIIEELRKDLHSAAVWSNESPRNERIENINEYLGYRNRYRRNAHVYSKRLLAWMNEDYALHVANLHSEAIAENALREANMPVPCDDKRPMHGCENYPITKWENIATHTAKQYVATHRTQYDTMEFRCFMMYEHHSDHAKQINLADALVKRTIRKIKTCEGLRMYGGEIQPQHYLADMKYSDAKRAFRNMLVSLDLDPDYYREECVNIALRKRAIRAGKVRK